MTVGGKIKIIWIFFEILKKILDKWTKVVYNGHTLVITLGE